MEADRKALAEFEAWLDERCNRAVREDGIGKLSDALCEVREKFRAAATALREEGEPVGWVMPKSLEFNRGRAGPPISLYMTQFSTAQIPLYRHPHTEEPTDD